MMIKIGTTELTVDLSSADCIPHVMIVYYH
jgi:hypothetical protein